MNDWLAGARILDLSHTYRTGMPQSPNHPPFRMLLERRHGDMTRADGASAANELIILGGHVGTHVDALAHVSQHDRLYGGIPAGESQSHQGFDKLSITDFEPYVGRAVHLDVAAVHGVTCLEPGYEVTAGDLEHAYQRAGVEIRPGDVILVGTGWANRWDEPVVFCGQLDGVPGPGVGAGQWLVDHAPRAVGAETIAFEHIAAGRGHALLPVHTMMLVHNGINIVETIDMRALAAASVSDFLLVLNPLKISGATGAPVRPLAVLP